MNCLRCKKDFQPDRPRGYCDQCVQHYNGLRREMARMSNPRPGTMVDGTFTKEASPGTITVGVTAPTQNDRRCGLCGSENVEMEYGMSGGYGCGTFMRCWDCGAVLDFQEDSE